LEKVTDSAALPLEVAGPTSRFGL